MYTIKKLNGSHSSQVLHLYYTCMKEDPYFLQLFKGEFSFDKFCDHFTILVQLLLSDGICIGAIEGDALIGMTLAFEYRDWISTKLTIVDRYVFPNQGDVAGWTTVIREFLSRQDIPPIYMIEVAVDEKYRRKHIADSMVRYMCDEYNPMYSLVADLSNPASTPLLQNIGFKVYNIDNVPIARKLGPGRWM